MATAAERICVVLLLVYLAWVPMPFGSNIDAAFLPLVVPPMILFAGAALLRLRDHDAPHLTFPYRAWTAGAVVFIMIVAWQLVPMPRPVLALVSPHSNAIWGWVNRLIFNRVTGTFVNPNHFAHYVALALPFTMFIAALAWRHTGATTMPLQRRMVLLFEKSLPLFSASIFAFVGCVAGIL